MTSLQVVLFFAAAAALAAAAPRPDGPPSYGPPAPHYKEPGMPFDFAYAVKDDYTGNDFSQNESSDGHVTKGSYQVLLPDGRRQIVTYTADHDAGFLADVAYEGEATYPAAPAYGPPAPPAYGPPAPPAYGPPSYA
ncbi:cuticle protein 18.6-like [Eriocheir sinensis]|uniref:cuticle protein 18.6-like n=1 Tax=Eriocheir sinensis TaxID=95602 RepID=UPI0021C6E89B|nr:cuticle protein 18.6-like [Eriocheir sinensis]